MTPTRLILLLALGGFNPAFAAISEGETSVKLGDVAPETKNLVPGDIDEEITNARLRAESGSKSKWSFSASTQYTAGPVHDVFGAERPVLVSEPGKQDTTSIDAGLNVRYRWSKNYSATLGTNFGLNTPLQGNVTPGQEQFNVYDPVLSVSRVGKIGEFQTNGSFGVAAGTSSQSQSVDRVVTYSLDYAVLHGFENGLTAGVMVSGIYNQYATGAGGNAANRAALDQTYGDYHNYYGGDSRSEYNVALFPFAEYAFNDRYQLRTVFGYFNYRHLLGDDRTGRWLLQSAYQSLGLGVSVNRNVYLYPNLQFVPDDIRKERTNVAFAATLNVF